MTHITFAYIIVRIGHVVLMVVAAAITPAAEGRLRCGCTLHGTHESPTPFELGRELPRYTAIAQAMAADPGLLLCGAGRSTALLGGATVTQTASVDQSLPVLLEAPGAGRICLPGFSCNHPTWAIELSRLLYRVSWSLPSWQGGRSVGAAKAAPPRCMTRASSQPASLA